ncbi:MAG: HAMP domain-containing histidine kinase [Novosphingobium sp.]|nr:HAMP domain-containing histidine kinase [Novosphingobium sp.]
MRLGEGDRNRAPEIARELALYGAAADPAIHGPFTIAVRQRDGRWLYLTTHRFPSVGVIGIGALSALVNLLLIGVSLWFGGRVAGPLRQFAASAERLRADAEVEPIPVTGPTELRAAAEALNHMQQRISRYVRERTSMIGAIAHDLRAPLSRLKFHVVSAPPKLRAAVEREIAEMEQLVGVTLDFVEADTRSGAFERLELSLLVEGIADDFADAGKDVEVVETAPLTICGNALLLRRLFTNLIDNALKYGGSARVRTCRENGCAIVEIDDVGPGLAPDDLARAFEPFFRGEKSRSRSTGGVGLGLAIARSAAVAHAGSIVLENLPERGLRARVFLSPSENA